MSYFWIEAEKPNPPKFCERCGHPVEMTDQTERLSVRCPDGMDGCAVAHYRVARVVRAWCPECERHKAAPPPYVRT